MMTGRGQGKPGEASGEEGQRSPQSGLDGAPSGSFGEFAEAGKAQRHAGELGQEWLGFMGSTTRPREPMPSRMAGAKAASP